jgi:hypothetical protein
MGLGYLTLATKSEQDKYLTGNPQFTFFKGVYKKHTNFATDFQYVNLIGDTNNSLGKKLYLELPKNGDLLYRAYLAINIKGTNNLTDVIPSAYSLIDYIDLFIGGQRIDRHYGSWLRIWHELNITSEKQLALSDMVSIHHTSNTKLLHIPLRFWFNNNIGTALPLLALQYNDVKIDIKFNSAEDVNAYSEYKDGSSLVTVNDTTFNISQVQVLCEYIHLDREERRLFMSNSHEYLITQVQTSLNNPVNLYNNMSDENYEKLIHKTDLRFNHPVKELIWSIQDSNALVFKSDDNLKDYQGKGIFNYNSWNGFKVGNDQLIGANIVLNGKDITEELPSTFYRSIQHYQYHSGVRLKSIKNNNTSANRPSEKYIDYGKGTGIYSYSFSISPEDFQPSGSLNFSNLEMAQLKYRLHRTAFLSLTVDLATGGGNSNINGYVEATQSFTNIVSIDNETPSTGDIILVKNQNTQKENGIYIYTAATTSPAQASSLVRHSSYNTSALFQKNNPTIINVKVNSSSNSGKKFLMNIKENGQLDTDNILVNELNDSYFKLNSKKLTIYAVNYNVFRILSGMGSLLFSA